ncbi:MAG TPA: 1-phosphofructokinase family hexose kinase [Thermoanaerobaculia bacterium]
MQISGTKGTGMGMESPPILCVTPNPALDRTLEVPALRPGAILRAASTRVAAGGKGVNVARGLRALGVRSLAMGPLGGASGKILADLAEAERLDAAWTWCDGIETRTCLILVDPDARQATVVNEPGPTIAADDWQLFSAGVVTAAAAASAVCISGSLPPGVAVTALAELCRSLARTWSRLPVWVDTSGAALGEALAVPGVRLKINREEAEEILGRALGDLGACVAAARELLARGASAIVLTLGADGALAASADGCWHAASPPVESASAVASGDSFLAGLVAALVAEEALPEALRHGVAAGAANAVANGGARFTREEFHAALSRVRARSLPR